MSVELFAEGGGTRLVLTEQGALFDDPAAPAAREHGTGELLDASGASSRGNGSDEAAPA